MKNILVVDSAVVGESHSIGNCKGLSASICSFLINKSEFDISMVRVDGGRELIRLIGEYDVVIMLYEGCLSDAIISQEKYPDVKFVILSKYVKRKKLASEKGFLVTEFSSDGFQELLDCLERGGAR